MCTGTFETNNLTTVFYHLGGVKARKLYDQGIRSVDDLKKHQGLLNAGQKIGLKYLEVRTELHVAVWARSKVRIRGRPKRSGPRIAFMYGYLPSLGIYLIPKNLSYLMNKR
jgi:hypothetical protein